jgi:hypothetical protein
MSGPKPMPTLAAVDEWFKDSILPARTAFSGISPNRVWKSPKAILKGNTEDPNGLCGDTTYFVQESFYAKFGDYRTSDGYHMGVVLWEGSVSNHIANVLMEQSKTRTQSYRWNPKTASALSVGPAQYSSSALLALPVYDLYYKKKRTTLKSWWSLLDAHMGGTIKIALLHNIDD